MLKHKLTLEEEEIHNMADSHYRTVVLRMAFRVILYSLLFFTLTQVILLDAQRINNQFSEQSYTEYAQELTLLATLLLFYLSVRFFPNQAVVGLLLGGFFGMSLIRELDAFLDEQVAQHTWKVLAYTLAIATVFWVYPYRFSFWKQLAVFIQSKAFGIILAGMLAVFIFSRFYGLQDIWLALMGAELYMYQISRISEESVELLGYTLVMVGTIEYLLDLRTSSRSKITTQHF